MKKLLIMALLLLAVGCSSDKVTITGPGDNGDQIDSNTVRIQLLEASQTLQDARLDALAAGLSSTNILILAIQSTQIDIVNLLESLD